MRSTRANPPYRVTLSTGPGTSNLLYRATCSRQKITVSIDFTTEFVGNV
jgi:hypothetical protein